MKKLFYFAVVLVSLSLLYNKLTAQLSEGGTPLSFELKSSDIQEISYQIMPFVDVEALKAEDEIVDDIGGIPYRFGFNHELDIDIFESGQLTEIPELGKLWRLGLKSENALSLNLTFNKFNLPYGAKLFVYNESRTQVLGAFTHKNNQNHGYFSTTLLQGDAVIIEYFEPFETEFKAELNLMWLTHGYRGPYDFVKSFGSSGDCNLNVACPEADGWEDQINSVAIMVTGGSGFCTGSLVNNTANDGTPYFLTADHCYSNPATWIFWFNWQSDNCPNPPTAPDYDAINGATLRARNSASDFCLVEINSDVPNEFNPYFSGWNRTLDANLPGPIICVHHPDGDIKKFSWSDGGVDASSYGGGAGSGTTHWRIVWSGGTTTEPGSSGSGLWDSNGLLIGQLHGGGAACGNTQPDWYGRFGVSWTGGGTNATRLSNWLDPGNDEPDTWPGYDPNATADNPPVADFEGNPTTVVIGGTVDFTDLSSNNPTSWAWTFQNGDPPNSPAQNPSITYNTLGTHNVQLIATNAHGNDSEVKNAYITVVDEGELVANFIGNPTTVVEGGTVQFTDQSSGPPTAWEWEFEGGDPLTSNDQNPEITYNTAGVYSVTLTASDGTEENTFTRTDYITVTPPGGGDLVAAFVASNYNLTAGQCINFNDQSQGGPTTWSWSFPGATPLTSSNQNPTNICYPNPGIYDVCLMVTRGADTDTYCCEGCIIVNPDPSLPIANFEAHQTTIPVGSVVHFTNLSENGPFMEWAWTFQGGIPYQVNDSTPPPIVYFTPGEYDVELRCKNTNGMQDVELKQNYIRVIPQATEPPTANFEANYTVIEPDDKINFIDFSAGNPYIWEWEFEGATPEFSYTQNPVDIEYPSEGLYYVRLKVSNNFGESTLIKEEYILVKSETDTCTDAPIVNFTADNRLIAAGGTVGFINQSSNYPTIYNWNFPGGTPNSSQEATPTTRIKYNLPGIYPVTLTASNDCGGDILTKEQYIYVFSGGVSEYCDTLTNVKPNEGISPRAIPQIGIGWLAGQNGDNIREYACHFENYTYSHIKGLLVPVSYAIYGAHSSYVTFYIWDGNSPQPDSILASKKVFIRDLQSDQVNHIVFDQAVEINGPFYLGFKINYPDTNNDGVSDDLFVIPIVNPRVNLPEYNTMYVKRGSDWFTANERYGFSSSLTIKPLTCLVEIDEFLSEFNVSIYPNPTTGLVSINLGDIEAKNINIEIYDILGRKSEVKEYKESFGEYSIDLSDKPDGMYIIRIKTGKYVINKKLLLSK
jgi:PKD repeat protein